MALSSLRRKILAGVCSLGAIAAAVATSHPVYLGTAPFGGALASATELSEDSSRARAPWLTLPAELAVLTPQFVADREAFVADLLRTGKVGGDRAARIASVAVREAYMRRVPPALVLGVMLTENDGLKATARSRVGAVGLMQVHPKPWRVLEKKFGANLKSDSTNLKYGIYILGYLAGEAGRRAESGDAGWQAALLRYNGCAKGTNTPNCHLYPETVKRNVQLGAHSLCGSLDFIACVVRPLWMAKSRAVVPQASSNE